MPIQRALMGLVCCLAIAACAVSPGMAALEECRLLRQPDIQGDRIVFVYGGDLWTVPRAGGVSSRLTTHEGVEGFPKFSPDGQSIAFTAEYDGNFDAFVVPAEGGEPRRLTWHPFTDQVAEWYPDGKSLLLRSARASHIQRFNRFFRVPVAGGFEEMLPLPEGGYASLSADGSKIAFVSPSYDNRTWKRYRGGNAPEIWVYDFKANTSEKITDWPGPDEWPMWNGKTVYYASDRDGKTVNLWAYDTIAKVHKRVTNFTDYDVKWPSIGGDTVVFEKGGYLFMLDLPGGSPKQIRVLVPADRPATRAEMRNVAEQTASWDLSPSAKRAVIEARGDLFTVPAEKGDVRNLTHSPASRERDASWSPDGKWIAYLSDASGEYEIHVIGSDGTTPDRQVTKGGNTFRFGPRWSPDSKKLAFSDKTMTLWWVDVATGKLTKVDKSDDGEIRDYSWSGDSRWIAYSIPQPTGVSRITLFSLDSNKATPMSDGMTDDFNPVFEPEGKYLYFISRRTLHPEFGGFELNLHFSATDKIYVAALRRDLPSPVAPESDEEKGDESKDDKDKKKDGDSDKSRKDDDPDATKDEGGKKGKDDKDKKEPEKVLIDLDGLSTRIAEVPVPAGRIAGLSAFKDRLLYLRLAPFIAGGNDGPQADAVLHTFVFDKRKEKTVLDGIRPRYVASKDGRKVLYRGKDGFGIVETSEEKKPGDGKISADNLMTVVDPRLEWMQMFNEAWRLERDFYYDPAMGGLDWKAVGDKYRPLIAYVAHRADLNYILGEMIGELATSHAYVGGGDVPQIRRTPVGLLGADFALDASTGRYTFRKIYRASDWNASSIAPLAEPGVEINEGDTLLAVNGIPLKAPTNLYAAFEGTSGRRTTLLVGKTTNEKNARTFSVTPIPNDSPLRYRAWVADNRAKVDKATNGRVAYIHVPNTAIEGIQEFTAQYYPQVDKEGIIVDERWNGGGFIPDFFVERLQRTTLARWSNRDGNGFRTPGSAIDGPKCILVNQYAGSGGDAFPYYFQMKKLGPVIGKRTWGGLVGISHDLPLVDGGVVTMPDFGMWNPRTGDWVVENHGVDPDIDVENAPEKLVSGHDPQLERGIEYVLEELKKAPPKPPLHPKYKVQ